MEGVQGETFAEIAGESWNVRVFQVDGQVDGLEEKFILSWSDAHINTWVEDLNDRHSFQPHLILLCEPEPGKFAQLALPILKYINGGEKGVQLFTQMAASSIAETGAFACVWALPTYVPDTEEVLDEIKAIKAQGVDVHQTELEGWSEVIVMITENGDDLHLRCFPVERDDEKRATAPVEVDPDNYYIKMVQLIKMTREALARQGGV